MLDKLYHSLEAIGYDHPIHPSTVHIPIGLLVGAMVLSLAALVFRRPSLAQAARYCMILALLFTLPTIILGIMDWSHYYNDLWLHAIKVKIVLSGILLVLLGLGVFVGREGVRLRVLLVPIYTLSFLTVAVLGYYGSELVYGGRAANIPASFAQAAAMYEANCGMCHPRGQSVMYPQLPLRNTPQLATIEQFMNQIRNPRLPDGSPGKMPPIPKDVVSDEQAWELYQYIVHVAGNRAPPVHKNK
jgi:uncharacterized membrane protein